MFDYVGPDPDILVSFDGGSSVLEMLFSGFMEVKKSKRIYLRAEGAPYRIISLSLVLLAIRKISKPHQQ